MRLACLTSARLATRLQAGGRTLEGRAVLVLPKHRTFPTKEPVKLDMSANKAYGIVFMVTLLLMIVITNVPLRGMWSVLVIMSLVMIVIILSLIEGAWDF